MRSGSPGSSFRGGNAEPEVNKHRGAPNMKKKTTRMNSTETDAVAAVLGMTPAGCGGTDEEHDEDFVVIDHDHDGVHDIDVEGHDEDGKGKQGGKNKQIGSSGTLDFTNV